jgi:hypothetical protein
MLKYLVLLTISVLLAISGCMTFQSPKVLEKGEQSLTVGASYFIPYYFGLEASFRTYVAKRLDAGLHLSLVGTGGLSLVADMKYQLMTEPFYLATGAGAGVNRGSQLYPFVQALLVGGTEDFYIGIKPVVYLHDIDSLDYLGIGAGGAVFAGFMLGKNRGFIIEPNVNVFSSGTFPIGVGAAWRFKF